MAEKVLLAGLDDIDWGGVTHAYGPATDVPALLRALVDPDNAPENIERQAKAYERTNFGHITWTLWGNVFHQGTVWQASAKVVPFLVEILRDGPEDAVLRRFLVRYLHHLALGYPEDVFPSKIDPVLYYAEAEKPPGNEDDPFDSVYMAGYARDCYLAVERALPFIASLARDGDEQVALRAIALQASFVRWAGPGSELLRALIAEHSTEAASRRAAAALVALAQLEGKAAAALTEIYVERDDRFLSIHAACARVLADPETTTDATISVLTRPLREAAEDSSPFTGTLAPLVSRCLLRLPESFIERAAHAIGENLAYSKPLSNLAETDCLLRLVFGKSRAPKNAAELNELQRRSLESIAAHGSFKLEAQTFGNYANVLHNWGLPKTSEALSQWLAGEPVLP